MKGFPRQEGVEQGSYTSNKQIGYAVARSPSFRGWLGSIRQIISLVLTRSFLIYWFKIPFLGDAKTVIKY